MTDRAEPAERRSGVPRGTIILLGLAAATVTAFGLASIRSIAAPFLLALILTICVHPLRSWMERRGVPRGIATGSTITAVFVLLAAFVFALVVAFGQFASLLPQYGPQLQQAATAVADWLKSIGFGQQQVEALVAGFNPSQLIAFFSGLVGSLASVTAGLVIVLTLLLLMAMDGAYVPSLLDQLATRRPQLVTALSGFAHGVRRYMVVTTVLGVAQGALNWLALLVMHVPGAFLWGLLSFLCSFIPNIGYFIAIIPPLFFGFLSGGWPVLIAVIVVYGVINAVVQSIVQPMVVGGAVSLNQTLTFVSVLFWAVVLGPLGAILAVPLTLLVRTVLIDADPNAAWWRPVTGDISEAKKLMKDADEKRRDERRSRRRGSADGGSPESDDHKRRFSWLPWRRR